MTMTDESVAPMLGQGRLLQTLSPALSDTARSGLPIDAPHAQWVVHVVQIGTCKNDLDGTRHINLFLEHSECGAVWLRVPVEKTPSNSPDCFACIDDYSLDGKAYGIVYTPRARFSRVRIDLVGVYEHPVPISALALVGPKTI